MEIYINPRNSTSLTDTEHSVVPTSIGLKGAMIRQCLLTMAPLEDHATERQIVLVSGSASIGWEVDA